VLAPARLGVLDARVRGTIVHALLEELDLAGTGTVDPDRIRALARREGAAATEADLAEVGGLVAAFLASAPARRLAGARVKTDRLEDPAADLEALVLRDYAVQRELYALAALRAGAERVEVVHLYLQRPDRPAGAVYRAADADRLAARLEERTAGLSRGEYPLTEHPHAELCATCPARGGLCPYPPERTLAPAAG
jgi:hypothetical protein